MIRRVIIDDRRSFQVVQGQRINRCTECGEPQMGSTSGRTFMCFSCEARREAVSRPAPRKFDEEREMREAMANRNMRKR